MIGMEDLARLLDDMPVTTVRRNWRKWGLHGVRIGRRIMFRERDIAAWLDNLPRALKQVSRRPQLPAEDQGDSVLADLPAYGAARQQIGRASCRERV